MSRTGQTGSALILVVGATAALSALALATLSVALVAYDIAVLEHEGAQARLLTRSALDLLARRLVSGGVPVPPLGTSLSWAPALPSPPAAEMALPVGCAVAVQVSRVPLLPPGSGPEPPDGAEEPPEALVAAVAESRCGRGFDRRGARFALATDGGVTRLY